MNSHKKIGWNHHFCSVCGAIHCQYPLIFFSHCLNLRWKYIRIEFPSKIYPFITKFLIFMQFHCKNVWQNLRKFSIINKKIPELLIYCWPHTTLLARSGYLQNIRLARCECFKNIRLALVKSFKNIDPAFQKSFPKHCLINPKCV